MADEIEEFDLTYSVLSPEWHGKAIVVPEINSDVVRPILFPMVSGVPSVTVEETGDVIRVDGYKTILADLRHREDLPECDRRFVPIHTPRESYRIITNEEVWDCMQAAIAALEGTGVKVTTAGTLQNLRKFYISVDLGDGTRKTKKGDKIASILNFRSAHDGSMMLEAGDSHTRIVCMNTFRWSRAYQGAICVRVPHTKNAAIQIENLAAYLAMILSGREKMLEAMSYLETLKMASPTDAAFVAAAYFNGPDAPADSELSTQAFNRASAIRDLAVSGKGNKGKTRYDLFNGFTEFFTHHDGAGGKKATKAKRWSVSNFGQAAEHKEAFLDLIMDEAKFNEALATGEKLFRDKEKLMAEA